MNTELRLAEIGDLDQLLPLVTAYHEFEHIESSAGERESALRQLVSEPTLGGIWLIYAEQALAGYIALCRGFSIEFNGFDAFVDEFYLSPRYRGHGIGRDVLETIKGKARDMRIRALHLEVAHSNQRARKLYAAAGFDPRDEYLLMSAHLQE